MYVTSVATRKMRRYCDLFLRCYVHIEITTFKLRWFFHNTYVFNHWPNTKKNFFTSFWMSHLTSS